MSYLDEAIAISSMKARAGRRRYSLVMPYALPLCLWVSQSPRCSRRRHLQERHSLFTMGYLHKHCPTLDSSPLQFFTLNILHFYGPQPHNITSGPSRVPLSPGSCFHGAFCAAAVHPRTVVTWLKKHICPELVLNLSGPNLEPILGVWIFINL